MLYIYHGELRWNDADYFLDDPIGAGEIRRSGVFVLLDDPGELVKLDIPVFSVFIQLVWYSSYDLVHLASNYSDNLRDKKLLNLIEYLIVKVKLSEQGIEPWTIRLKA